MFRTDGAAYSPQKTKSQHPCKRELTLVTALCVPGLTNSQLRYCVLVEPAELCSVDVVGCKGADEILQPFLA